MDLIPAKQIDPGAIAADPIATIIEASTVVRDMNLSVRARFLAELEMKIEELQQQAESQYTHNTMYGIGATFATLMTLATAGTFVPIVGATLSVISLGASGTCLYNALINNVKLEPAQHGLEKLRLALKSTNTDKWAAVWQVAGNDIFVYALKEAAKGEVVGGKLVQLGSDRPIDRAIETIAAFQGSTYEAVADAARAILDGKAIQQAPSAPLLQPTVRESPQCPSFSPVDIAASIGDDLSQGYKAAKEQQTMLQQRATQQQPKVPVAQPERDIVDTILGSVNSLAFIGDMRCGKSMLMATASRIGVQRGKFKAVNVISSLTKAGEDQHYWSHCSSQSFYDLAAVVDKSSYYGYFLDTIRKFKKTATYDNPQLLIIDEFAFLCESLESDARVKTETALDLIKEIADLGGVVASGGAKRGWYVWIGSPQGAIGDMGRGGRVMKKLSLVFCAIAPGTTANTKGLDVVWNDTLCDATARNWTSLSRPPRGVAHDLSERIVWFNGKWHASSIYDLNTIALPQDQKPALDTIATEDALSRDERQVLKAAVATQERTNTDIMIEMLERSNSDTLDAFIARDIKASHRTAELKPHIIRILNQRERYDLLQRFGVL